MGSIDQDNGTSGPVLASSVPDQDTSDYEPGVEPDIGKRGEVMNTDPERSQNGGGEIPNPADSKLNDLGDPPKGNSVFKQSASELPQAPPDDEDESPRVSEPGEQLPQPPKDAESHEQGNDQPPPPSSNGQPPVPMDGEPPASDGRWRRWFVNHRVWWLAAVVVAIFATLFALLVWPFGGFDDGGDDVVAPVDLVVSGGIESSSICQVESDVDLEKVGVLSHGDSLEYNNINSLWASDNAADDAAGVVVDNAVDELYRQDRDGCAPAIAVSYWRGLRSDVIDADRPGIDNNDTITRTAAYTEDADTRVAVAEETASQLSSCVDNAEYVELTVEEAPAIFVAMYAKDYEEIVFVETSLPQEDELSSGDQGLIVIRCAFGKTEGSSGVSADGALISPSMRAIVYLNQPTGVQASQIVLLEPLDTDSEEPGDDSGIEPSITVPPTTTTTVPTTEADKEPPVVTVPPTDSTSTTEADKEPPVVTVPPTDSTSTTEADKEPPVVTVPPTDSTSTTEADKEPPVVTVPPVVEVEDDQTPTTDEEESTPIPEPEPTPVTSEEDETDEGEPMTGQTDNQADDQKPSDGSGDGCDGSCGTNNGGQSGGNDCTGDCPGDGGGSDGNGDGNDCTGDCPGDGGGSDGNDCTGDCPGDGGGDPEPACLPGQILDPNDNCKDPDPGVDPDGDGVPNF